MSSHSGPHNGKDASEQEMPVFADPSTAPQGKGKKDDAPPSSDPQSPQAAGQSVSDEANHPTAAHSIHHPDSSDSSYTNPDEMKQLMLDEEANAVAGAARTPPGEPIDETPKKDKEEDMDPSKVSIWKLFTGENMKVGVVPLIGGYLNGYTLGFTGPYTQLNTYSTDCSEFMAQESCTTVPFADCVWLTGTSTTGETFNYCGWEQFTCRASYPNSAWPAGGNTATAEVNCDADSRCTWSYSAKQCQNPAGFNSLNTGIFACSMVIGNLIGAIVGGRIVVHLGARLTFFIGGVISLATCVMCVVDAVTYSFWVLTVSRFILGIFMGLITVACPLYVSQNAHPLYRRRMGTFFSVFGATGSLTAGIMGLGLGQSVYFTQNKNQELVGRRVGMVCPEIVLCICMILLGIFCRDSRVTFKNVGPAPKKPVADEDAAVLNEEEEDMNAKITATHHHAGPTVLDEDEFSFWDMKGQLAMAVCLNATFRFTGFMAFTQFGPKIMAGFGLAPMVGNFVVQIVNWGGAVTSLIVTQHVPLRPLFLSGSCFISLMGIFFCGVPVYPGVATTKVMNGVAIAGVVLFIFFYQVCIAPVFFILTQEMFPPSFRPKGSSFAQPWQFVFVFIITLCYSICVEKFSGGPDKDQHKGQSILFIFFGGLGLVLFVLEFFFLTSWQETAAGRKKLQRDREAHEERERQAAEQGLPSAGAHNPDQ